MTGQKVGPPPLYPTKPKRRWLWAKLIIGIVAAGFLVVGLIGAANSPSLELSRIGAVTGDDGMGIEIVNVGTKPIAITKITINDRADCSIRTLGQVLQGGINADPENEHFEGQRLAVGDKVTYISSCLIIRAQVETDSGSGTYSFNSH